MLNIWLTDNNAQIGQDKKNATKNKIVGKYTIVKKTEPVNGCQFIKAACKNDLRIANTFQEPKNNGDCGTFTTNKKKRRQIDFIAVSKAKSNWITKISNLGFANRISTFGRNIILANFKINRKNSKNTKENQNVR